MISEPFTPPLDPVLTPTSPWTQSTVAIPEHVLFSPVRQQALKSPLIPNIQNVQKETLGHTKCSAFRPCLSPERRPLLRQELNKEHLLKNYYHML